MLFWTFLLNSIFQFSYIKYTCLHGRTPDSQPNINDYSQLLCWEQKWSSGLPHFVAALLLIEARLGAHQGTFCGVTFEVASLPLQVQKESAPGHKLQYYNVYNTDLCSLLCTLHLPHFCLQGWTTVRVAHKVKCCSSCNCSQLRPCFYYCIWSRRAFWELRNFR